MPKEPLDIPQPVFPDLMRRKDESDVRMGIRKMVQLLFVFHPRAAGDDHRAVAAKLLHQGHRHALAGDLDDPVEPRISAKAHPVPQSQTSEQHPRGLRLDKKMGKTFQHITVHPAIPLKKGLIRSEDPRYQKDGYLPALQFSKKIKPIVVLDPQHNVRIYQIDKLTRIARTVQWKIKDMVRTIIIFIRHIARRRKKTQDDPAIRRLLPQLLEHRPALFEFTKR